MLIGGPLVEGIDEGRLVKDLALPPLGLGEAPAFQLLAPPEPMEEVVVTGHSGMQQREALVMGIQVPADDGGNSAAAAAGAILPPPVEDGGELLDT